MSAPLSRLAVTALAVLALACSKDSNAPDATTQLTGHWISADTVDVFTAFDIQVVQNENGIVRGSWVGKTRIINGKCDSTFGCAPANSVTGSNLSLRIDLEILGAGSFTGQLVTRDVIQGQIVRFGIVYNLRLHKAN